MRLFSYRVVYDMGSAPNPFWGTCTLVICKPAVRRSARVGDWVVGVGSEDSPTGDLSRALIYAMRIDCKLDMAEYDAWVLERCPRKVPDPRAADIRRRYGDALYNFAFDPPAVRPGVHSEADRPRDLSGRYALLSDHFVYFGGAAVSLPSHLLELGDSPRGHRSSANDSVAASFVTWLESLGHPWGSVVAAPSGWPAEPPLLTL